MYVVKCMRFESFQEGRDAWANPGCERREFASLTEAYRWAEQRSKSHSGQGSVYQVFRKDNEKQGSPYRHGFIYTGDGGPKNKEHTYVLQFKDLTPDAQWKWFDTGDKIGKEYTLEAARKRIKSCLFSGKHWVRITRQSNPVFTIYLETPQQKELEAFINGYEEGEVINQPVYGQESEMNISKPLNVPRTTIIEKVQAYLDERQAKHDEKVAKEQERQAERLEAFNRIAAIDPTRLLSRISTGHSTQINVLIEEILDDKLTDEQIKTRVEEWPISDTLGSYQKDEDAEKTLSVLNAATDETIEVSTESSLYRYL